MSLDIYLEAGEVEFEWFNITHNLATMASKAGLYVAMWTPERLSKDEVRAEDVIDALAEGIARLVKDRVALIQLNPENGWGTYEGLLRVATQYLIACVENPELHVRASR